MFENGCVEFGGLFSLFVKPQVRRDCLHVTPFYLSRWEVRLPVVNSIANTLLSGLWRRTLESGRAGRSGLIVCANLSATIMQFGCVLVFIVTPYEIHCRLLVPSFWRAIKNHERADQFLSTASVA